jgi:hypothetical protein
MKQRWWRTRQQHGDTKTEDNTRPRTQHDDFLEQTGVPRRARAPSVATLFGKRAREVLNEGWFTDTGLLGFSFAPFQALPLNFGLSLARDPLWGERSNTDSDDEDDTQEEREEEEEEEGETKKGILFGLVNQVDSELAIENEERGFNFRIRNSLTPIGLTYVDSEMSIFGNAFPILRNFNSLSDLEMLFASTYAPHSQEVSVEYRMEHRDVARLLLNSSRPLFKNYLNGLCVGIRAKVQMDQTDPTDPKGAVKLYWERKGENVSVFGHLKCPENRLRVKIARVMARRYNKRTPEEIKGFRLYLEQKKAEKEENKKLEENENNNNQLEKSVQALLPNEEEVDNEHGDENTNGNKQKNENENENENETKNKNKNEVDEEEEEKPNEWKKFRHDTSFVMACKADFDFNIQRIIGCGCALGILSYSSTPKLHKTADGQITSFISSKKESASVFWYAKGHQQREGLTCCFSPRPRLCIALLGERKRTGSSRVLRFKAGVIVKLWNDPTLGEEEPPHIKAQITDKGKVALSFVHNNLVLPWYSSSTSEGEELTPIRVSIGCETYTTDPSLQNTKVGFSLFM